MYLKGLILYCHSYIQQSRSIYSAFHLLRGKKGIQSLHDARLFHLENIFGIYPTLHKKVFDQTLDQLINLNLIEKSSGEADVYKVTSDGDEWLELNKEKIYIKSFNGLAYNKKDKIFFNRLLLIIQTFTNLKGENKSFIPIVDDPQIIKWVKESYKNMAQIPIDKIVYNLYHELHCLLQSLSDNEAEFIIDHLSGYNFYGLNANQLAKKYSIELADIYLIRTALIHQMLAGIERNINTYKLLSKFINYNDSSPFLMNTTLITYNLLKKGLSAEQVAKSRYLKLNTIYDHIVEIALFDEHFSTSKYVNDQQKQEILNAILHTKSYKLKNIKEKVSEDISYFQIRLILTETNKFHSQE